MKVGIMLMSDRGPDGAPMDLKRHLQECKDGGIEMVDLFDDMLKGINMTPLDAKKMLLDIGLSPSVFCVRTDLVSPDPQVRNNSLQKIEYGIGICDQLDIDHLFSHGGQHNNKGAEALARYVDGLGEAADTVAEAGMVLSIENAGTLCHTDTEILRCLNSVNKSNLKITFDTGNFVLAGSEPHKAAELLASRVIHVHAKAFEQAPTDSERSFPDKPYRYCPIGEGLIDFRRILDILGKAGFDGCVSFEPEGGQNSKWYQSIRTLSSIIRDKS
jgi:sugar phosphate isomerase/epimerase